MMNAISLKRAGAFALAAVMACSLSFPVSALASVWVDDAELAPGENAVGGGTATLGDSALDMANVSAGTVAIDQDLLVNFIGGNVIDMLYTAGSAHVELSFSGENAVEDIYASEESQLVVNADGHNDFEDVEAYDQSSVTINVTGENDFEQIDAYDNASITVRGTTCQMKDIINLGEGEERTALLAAWGNMVIDHVTINLKAEIAYVGSENGDVVIDTSKVAKDDGNEYAVIIAGGALLVRESVIDIAGSVSSVGEMTIEHSDVKAEAPDAKYQDGPYRVWSKTGIKLIREKNGEVKEGEIDGERVYYVDTGDGDDVDLEADGKPAYYKCSDDSSDISSLPKTGDDTPLWPLPIALFSAATIGIAARRSFGDGDSSSDERLYRVAQHARRPEN